MKVTLRSGCFLAFMALISACSDTVVRDDQPPKQPTQDEQVQQAIDAKDWINARDLLQAEIDKASGDKKQALQLLQIEIDVQLEDFTTAKQHAEQLSQKPESGKHHTLLTLLSIHGTINQENAFTITSQLKDLASEDALIEALRNDLLAQSQRLSGRQIDAIATLVTRGQWLSDEIKRLRNEERVWLALQALPYDDLLDLIPPPPDTFGAWVELSFIHREYSNNKERLENELALWNQRYPTHPGADRQLYDYLATLSVQSFDANTIAVFLPLSGKLASVGAAVRNGILAQHLEAGEDAPELIFYDTAAANTFIYELVENAVTDGAQLIIGPLRKEQVNEIVAISPLPMPVVALNSVSDDSIEIPNNFFQFGLSPEDDASSTAAYMGQHGISQAALLVPNNDWGSRISQSFSDSFVNQQGQVVGIAAYNSKSPDHGPIIKRLLHIDQSYARKRQTSNIAGMNLEFEPRRRQDVEAIFMAAQPKQARLIKPQLKFHRAGDIPVYATSDANSADNDIAKNKDLNGLNFVEIPLLISPKFDSELQRETFNTAWPALYKTLPRLLALGADAYLVYHQLPQMRHNASQTVNGLSGLLSVGRNNQIQRQLEYAKFVSSKPRWQEKREDTESSDDIH